MHVFGRSARVECSFASSLLLIWCLFESSGPTRCANTEPALTSTAIRGSDRTSNCPNCRAVSIPPTRGRGSRPAPGGTAFACSARWAATCGSSSPRPTSCPRPVRQCWPRPTSPARAFFRSCARQSGSGLVDYPMAVRRTLFRLTAIGVSPQTGSSRNEILGEGLRGNSN